MVVSVSPGGEGSAHSNSEYYRDAPLARLQHPLEENLLASLLATLASLILAVLVAIPVLLICLVTLSVSYTFRYGLLLITGTSDYVRFQCSSRRTGSSPSFVAPADKVASNDVRWLINNGGCQPILHTVLVFENKMELGALRSLVQTRVLEAVSPEGQFAYPRLMQRVVRRHCTWEWETMEDFELNDHIFAEPHSLHTEAQLQAHLANLLTEDLPMDRPLWEIRMVSRSYGPQKDMVAVVRVHQSLADGMTLVRILSHSLSDQLQIHIPERPHFAAVNFPLNVFRALIVGPLTFIVWLALLSRDLNFFSRPWGSSHNNHNCDGLANNSHSEHSSEMNHSEGGENHHHHKSRSTWNVAWSASIPLPKVIRVKQIMRSSLNDVLLAAATGSIRHYLKTQGISFPDDLKVAIPVDLRNDISSPKCSTRLGCKVSCVLTKVPSGTESAIPRLWASRRLLDDVKASADPVIGYGATFLLMNLLPASLSSSILDSITNKASLVFCNVPGPRETLLVGRVPLKGIYPFYPPPGKLRLSVTCITYADQVHLTVLAHRSLPRAGSVILAAIAANVESLSQQLSLRRVPGESRLSRAHRLSHAHTNEMSKPPTRQIHRQLVMVQEELQALSSRLDDHHHQHQHQYMTCQEEPPDSLELRSRVKLLKNEFSDLMTELRRRSSIEGLTVSFEDEEREEEYRRPRKRALSVVSVSMGHRRSSIFAATAGSSGSGRALATPESSSGGFSSDEDSPSTPQRFVHPMGIRLSASPIRTTAV